MSYRISSIIDNEFSCSGVNAYWSSLSKALTELSCDVSTIILNHRDLEWDAEAYHSMSGRTIRLDYSNVKGDLENKGYETLCKICPDLIIHHYSDIGLDFSVKSADSRWKNVYICHSDDPDHYKRSLKRAAQLNSIIAVSDVCKRTLIKQGLQEDKIYVIPYIMCDVISTAANHHGKLKLVYIGRLEEYQKRSYDIVRLVQALGQQGIDYEFSIAGSGTLSEKIELDLEDFIKLGKVKMHGFLSQNELKRLLEEADIFLNFSEFEGLSTSLVQAMANGCLPVVSQTKSGGHFLKDGVNALLFPVGDIKRCLSHITKINANPDKLFSVRTRAAETINQNFSPAVVKPAIIKFLKETQVADKFRKTFWGNVKAIVSK